MIVIGGYNSSNTRNLARLAGRRVPTYHIADAGDLLSIREVRHRPVQDGRNVATAAEARSRDWLPDLPVVSVGLTAGASTPDSAVGPGHRPARRPRRRAAGAGTVNARRFSESPWSGRTPSFRWRKIDALVGQSPGRSRGGGRP